MNEKKIELRKHSAVIQISQKISAQQRKAYNGLLWIAREKLKKEPSEFRFRSELLQLRHVTGLAPTDTSKLRKSVMELMNITVEYNLLGKDKARCWGSFVLLAGVSIDGGYVEFSFPHQVHDILLNPKMYSLLDLNIVRGLGSKYSIALYELARDYMSAEIPKLDIETFRSLMGVNNGQYSLFGDLRRYVIDSSVKEINTKTDLDIWYKLFRNGRKVTHIKFSSKKKDKEKDCLSIKNIDDVDSIKDLLDLIPERHRSKRTVIKAINSILENHDRDYVIRNILYSNEKAGKSYAGFFRKCLKEDWGHDWVIDQNYSSQKECPFCKGNNFLIFKREDGSFTEKIECKHGEEAEKYIKYVKLEYRYEFCEALIPNCGCEENRN